MCQPATQQCLQLLLLFLDWRSSILVYTHRNLADHSPIEHFAHRHLSPKESTSISPGKKDIVNNHFGIQQRWNKQSKKASFGTIHLRGTGKRLFVFGSTIHYQNEWISRNRDPVVCNAPILVRICKSKSNSLIVAHHLPGHILPRAATIGGTECRWGDEGGVDGGVDGQFLGGWEPIAQVTGWCEMRGCQCFRCGDGGNNAGQGGNNWRGLMADSNGIWLATNDESAQREGAPMRPLNHSELKQTIY